MKNKFRKISGKISSIMGSSWSFFVALLMVLIWALAGPLFQFSNTWQLLINTITTVSTFLMVFLIQNTQNRDTKAIHLKLDELIRVSKGRNSLISIEELDDKTLEDYQNEFRKIYQKYEEVLAKRRKNKKDL